MHIGKGRLHAFRKVSPHELPPQDCHAQLRKELLVEVGTRPSNFSCFAIAWDWCYMGVTRAGIRREAKLALDAADICREEKLPPLGITELSLLETAKITTSSARELRRFVTNKVTLAGILPALLSVVNRDVNQSNRASRFSCVSLGEHPDSHGTGEAEAYAHDGYSCMICQCELSNTYLHCRGCEKFLKKDFNICVDCRGKDANKEFVSMSGTQIQHSLCNHTGNRKMNQGGKDEGCDKCKKDFVDEMKCEDCHGCFGSCCSCHRDFILRWRISHPEEMVSLVMSIEKSSLDDSQMAEAMSTNAASPVAGSLDSEMAEATATNAASPAAVRLDSEMAEAPGDTIDNNLQMAIENQAVENQETALQKKDDEPAAEKGLAKRPAPRCHLPGPAQKQQARGAFANMSSVVAAAPPLPGSYAPLFPALPLYSPMPSPFQPHSSFPNAFQFTSTYQHAFAPTSAPASHPPQPNCSSQALKDAHENDVFFGRGVPVSPTFECVF